MDLAQKLKEFNKQHEEHSVFSNRDEKVLLVDGLNSFIRCFAATPTMNDNGDHIGGMTGFLRSLALTIRQFKPSRCVVVFDGTGGSQRRRAIFKEYKGHRRNMTKLNRTYDFQTPEDEQKSQKYQLQLLVTALQHLPVTIVAPNNVEADDVLAYFAKLTAERGGEAIIMSTDKDFLQLISPKIKVWNPVKKKLYNEETVVEEYGIHPQNFIILRTIEGDKSDNIPGIKGIGPATLKKHFAELSESTPVPWEHIFAVAENNDSKAAQHILNNKPLLERNVSLMRLDEQHMSGMTRMSVLQQFDAPIPPLNKLALTRLFVRDRLLGTFLNLDEWATTTFAPLSRFSNKD